MLFSIRAPAPHQNAMLGIPRMQQHNLASRLRHVLATLIDALLRPHYSMVDETKG